MVNKKIAAESQKPVSLNPAFAVMDNGENTSNDNDKNNDIISIKNNDNDIIKNNDNCTGELKEAVLKREKKSDSFDRVTTYIHKDFNAKLDALAAGQKGVKMDIINEALKAYLKKFK